MTALLWLRRDLRLHDHPALHAALHSGEPLVPVYVLDDRLLHGRHESGNRTGFLLESLRELDAGLRERGSALVIRRGDPARELRRLAEETGSEHVHLTADAGPYARARDRRTAAALGEVGTQVHAHPGMFVVDELEEVRTGGGSPFTVFSPFHRAWARQPRRRVLPRPGELPRLARSIDRGAIPELSDLGLQAEAEEPLAGGEGEARRRAFHFLGGAVAGYRDGQDALADPRGTSRLSPYLHFGCISPRELEARAYDAGHGARPQGEGEGPAAPGGPEAWLRQLCWRDFFAQVLLGFPRNTRREHQERYRGTLRWSRAERRFQTWRDGLTGYPLVDAGMRQLAREGWMHNRARLVVGSFLTKDLAIDWRWGERWFMRHLLDGDEASNNGNWQWIASVGVDPQPPFKRMFNPARQQERFDPDGGYVRRHVPELERVPDRYLREPWRMPEALQRECGCVIGRDYPQPIVDHAAARRAALERYAQAGR